MGRILKAREERVKPFKDNHSPVYFSTDETGKRWFGLSKIPDKDEQLLFVGNHQFGGLDLSIIFDALLEQRDIVIRALAHPMIFSTNYTYELQGRTPGIKESKQNGNAFLSQFELYREFGGVPVNPRNFFKLMKSGQDALLFPDGVREATGIRVDPYGLKTWPNTTDFVRVAAKFNVTIIPFSATGMLESVNMVADSDDQERIQKNLNKLFPRLENLREEKHTKDSTEKDNNGEDEKGNGGNQNRNNGLLSSPRYGSREQERIFRGALAAPSVPARNYFIFGKPMSTKDIDPNDKLSCYNLYEEVREEVKRGLKDLQLASENDPFKDTAGRIAYERLTGKQAPTFSVDELNKK